MSQLSCKNLNIGYGSKTIIDNLSFEVESGEYLCIIGHNGTGKSTLMRTILRLQPLNSGSITLDDGVKLNEVGYLPQQTPAQADFPASVWEIVLSGCLNRCGVRPFYNANEKKRANHYIDMLEITPLSKRCYRELSGGQQQRVLLARALCATHKMLLLDEPTASLDPDATQELYRLIKDINQKEGITVIMISHDLTVATQYCDKVLKLGDSPFYGTRTEYIQSMQIEHNDNQGGEVNG
ncbi:MAG: ABC transporter ATP-binding protein [Clostridia bacterium]|nr:ABC transporter ATP-binding protein [Clostridia bacterium]